MFLLPALITIWLFYQIYFIVNGWVIEPVARFILPEAIENASWLAVKKYVRPPLSLLAVLMFVYLMGYLFQSRLHRLMDWVFLKLPGVSVLYRAIRDVSDSLHGPRGLAACTTVVMVPFPNPDIRMVGYLMGEREDAASGEKLACIYIPIGVFPPSGYTIVMRRADVIVTQWETTAPWKLLVSGGLTFPTQLPFSAAASKDCKTID